MQDRDKNSKIKLLPQDTIDKIAAGEVIQRPVSVVKELIENSIDARAQNITIEIKSAGKRLIRIIDDGEGMTKEDLLLCIKRHATSKIKNFSDIRMLSTLGFRGEALASIAAVSKLKIASIHKNSQTNIGNSITIEGGNVGDIRPCSINSGSVVEVRDLFYNTPARFKFLKSDNIEFSHINSIVLQYCIAYYRINFKLIHNSKELINTKKFSITQDMQPKELLLNRILSFYSNKLKDSLFYFERDFSQIKLYGYLTYPYRATQAKLLYIYVNRRPVTSKLVLMALKSAYAEFIPKLSHFCAFIFIELHPSLIDVNIHPCKEEIKFFNDNLVYQLLKDAVLDELKKTDIIKYHPIIDEEKERPLTKEIKSAIDKYYQRVKPSIRQPQISKPYDKKNERKTEQLEMITIVEKTKLIPMGQIYDAYLIVQNGDQILIIDQHALEERILFEKLKEELKYKKLTVQKLLVPIIIELEPKQKEVLLSNLKILKELGFDIEEFGGQQFIIRAVPLRIKDKINKEAMLEIVDELTQQESVSLSSVGAMLALISCHLAVKAGQKLDMGKINALIDEFSQLKVPYSCPHGRCFVIELRREEIEKKFARL